MFRIECPNCDYEDKITSWLQVKEMAKGNCPKCENSSKACIFPYRN